MNSLRCASKSCGGAPGSTGGASDLPSLPVSVIVVMVCVVSALRSFDLVMIMTLGGPYDSSTVLGYYMYEQTFLSVRFGYAAAIATILFLLMWLFVGVLLRRMLQRERA